MILLILFAILIGLHTPLRVVAHSPRLLQTSSNDEPSTRTIQKNDQSIFPLIPSHNESSQASSHSNNKPTSSLPTPTGDNETFSQPSRGTNDTSAYVTRESDIAQFKNLSKHYREIPIDTVKKYYRSVGPVLMLEILDSEGHCHDKGHNIGRVVYMETGHLIPSVITCKNRCSHGCFHGVLIQYFATISSVIQNRTGHEVTDSQIRPFFDLLCDSNYTASLTLRKISSRNDCYHNIGHAVMFISNYNSTRALNNCKSINRKISQYYCATGAYHQYFLTKSSGGLAQHQRMNSNSTQLLKPLPLLPSLSSSSSSWMFPCDASNDFPAGCYRPCFLYNKEVKHMNHTQLASLCLGMSDKWQREGCFHGYGYYSHWWLEEKQLTITELCSVTSTSDELQQCVEGAAEAPWSDETRESICENLREFKLRNACFTANVDSKGKNMTLYYSTGPMVVG